MRRGTINLGALTGQADIEPPKVFVLPDSRAAATQVSKTFPYQSYFDDTLLWLAIREQNNNNPIVQSTFDQQQLSGYAIGNHPDSETPIAVVFSGEGRQSGSAAHIIPPGGIVTPAKGSTGGEDGFQSFSWGLPYGWLGGGTATIVIFQTPDAWANWTPRSQVLFHRFRSIILAPGDLPALLSFTWPFNWPTRFPNFVMQRGNAPAVPQQGAAQIAISQPGQTIFRVQTTVATAASIKALFYRTTDFSDEITSVPATIPLDAVEFTVPAHTAYPYPAGYAEYTIFEGPEELSRLGCNGKQTFTQGGVYFVSDDANLQNQYIDVCRYGYL